MATAQVQQVVAAPVHDKDCAKEEEKNNEIIQDPPCAKVDEQDSDANVHKNGDTKNEEVPATDTNEDQWIAQEVETRLVVQPAEAEGKETKKGRLARGAKKTEKVAAKGAIVPVDNDTDDEIIVPEGVKKTEKAAAKWAVVPVDEENDEEVVAPAGDQAPAEAPVASEEVAKAAGEEATKGGKEDTCEEKPHEE